MMPKTNFQKVIFSILMAVFMVYGMETYNRIILNPVFSYKMFLVPTREVLGLSVCVVFLQTFVGMPTADYIISHIKIRRKLLYRGNNILYTIAMASCMCPMMSFVAAVLFKSSAGIDKYLLFIWIKTMMINLPMALFWQIIVAGPSVRFIFYRIFLGSR